MSGSLGRERAPPQNCWRERLWQRRLPMASPRNFNGSRTRRVANLWPEEPDAVVLHVRICEGAGGAIPPSYLDRPMTETDDRDR